MPVSTKTLLGTAILGGVITFILAAIWWRVLNLSGNAYKSAPVGWGVESLKELGGDGAFFVPGVDEAKWTELQESGDAEALAASEAEWNARHRAGPVAMVIVQQQGMEAMPPSTFGWAFSLDCFVALGLAWVMAQVGARGEPYLWLRRWRTAVVAVTAAAAFIHGCSLIWFHYPPVVALMGFVEVWCVWAIASAVMAIMMTRCSNRCAAAGCGCG